MTIIEVNKDNFNKEVLESEKKVLVDFNASWCGPCKMLKPILEEVSSDHDSIKIVSINIDDEEELAEEYNVFSFFVGTIVRFYGKFGGFVIAFLFMLITRFYVSSYSRSGAVIDLLIVFILFQIPMNGVFYYRQSVGSGDVIYALFWLAAVVYKKIKL